MGSKPNRFQFRKVCNMIPLFHHLSCLVRQLHRTLRYHYLPHLVRQFHSLHHLLYRFKLRLPHRLPWWLFRPWRMPMHTWTSLSRGWDNWEYQIEGWHEMILMDYQGPVACLPAKFRMSEIERYMGIGCLHIHLDYIVLWWGPMVSMRLRWLCYSPCPWVVITTQKVLFDSL